MPRSDVRHLSLSSAAIALLVLSVGVNVLQARRIRDLLAPAQPVAARVGDTAQPIAGYALDGQPVRITFDDGVPTVLYYFASTCGWCEKNWANLTALAAASAGRYRVVAVSKERGLRAFVQERGLTFEVVEGVPDAVRAAFGFTGTPHTAMVSSQGLITHEWIGAFSGRSAFQIEELFGLQLPGLLQP